MPQAIDELKHQRLKDTPSDVVNRVTNEVYESKQQVRLTHSAIPLFLLSNVKLATPPFALTHLPQCRRRSTG